MSNNSTQYFETLNPIQGELTEDVLVQRMAECNMVLGQLANNPAWKILLDDVRALSQMLDDNWQQIVPSSDKFSEARIMKIACKHISDFPAKYLKELQDIEEALKSMQEPEKIIQKDSDNE